MALTYPFRLEKKRCERAEKAYPELQKMADDFILKKNDELILKFREMPIGDAFAQRDLELAASIRAGGAKE
jgi:cell division GTPase FtsZ